MAAFRQPEDQFSESVPDAVNRVFQSGFKLNINPIDSAFLAGLQTFAEIEQTFSLSYGDLEWVFGIVGSTTGSQTESLPQHVQRAVDRLIRNQLLIRVDSGGLTQQSQYDISSLGKAILNYLNQTETLTKQNLAVITSRILNLLSEIRKAIHSSGSEQFWEESVIQPLKHVVVELLDAIEKRQRGLDQEQEEVRAEIGHLLEKSWLDALSNCESLLDTTGKTLQELYRTLLSENTAIKQGLNEVYEAAERFNEHRVLAIIDRIYLRLDHLEQWGKERVASWSQYYRRVNDFLQSIVRFDPNRELSHALKEAIQDYPKHPWFLSLIDPPVYRELQEIRYNTSRQRIIREVPLPVDYDEADDDGNLLLDQMIEEIKQHLMARKPLDLMAIIRPYLENHSLDLVFPHVGRLIDLMLKEIDQRPDVSKEWVKPLETLQFEMQNLVIKPPE